MHSKEQRKEAIKHFKEKKVQLGVFAVRCTGTGNTWVGASRNLDATKNGCWFSLRLGSHHDKTLQAEWNDQGEPAFRYEVLDTLKDDVLALNVPDLLKEKKAHWVAALGARPLL